MIGHPCSRSDRLVSEITVEPSAHYIHGCNRLFHPPAKINFFLFMRFVPGGWKPAVKIAGQREPAHLTASWLQQDSKYDRRAKFRIKCATSIRATSDIY
jgi:hypothetical protein